MYNTVHLAFKLIHYMTEFTEKIKNFLFFVNLKHKIFNLYFQFCIYLIIFT